MLFTNNMECQLKLGEKFPKNSDQMLPSLNTHHCLEDSFTVPGAGFPWTRVSMKRHGGSDTYSFSKVGTIGIISIHPSHGWNTYP
jgi:hypothetical protein